MYCVTENKEKENRLIVYLLVYLSAIFPTEIYQPFCYNTAWNMFYSESRNWLVQILRFFFFNIDLAILVPLHFHIHFRIILVFSAVFLLEFSLRFYSMYKCIWIEWAILTIMILEIHKQTISLYLFRWSGFH